MTDILARQRTIVGTSAEWAANDQILGDGEIALERQSASVIRAKVGDGVSPFSESPNLFATGAENDSANLTFLQAGTGAVERTAQDKMRERVSVKDFGAVGDGVTDDTATIQAAIDAGRYSAVYFPTGHYKISATLNVGQGTFLEGDGIANSIIIQMNLAADGILFDPQYAAGGGLRGLSIHAGGVNLAGSASTASGLVVRRANGAFLAEQFDVNAFCEGIYSYSNFYAQFQNFQILGASVAGVHLAAPPASPAPPGGAYQDSSGIMISAAKISNFGRTAERTGVGLLIEQAAGDHYTSLDCTSFGTGVRLAPTAGSNIAFLFVNRVLGDTADQCGWVIDATYGSITAVSCVDCWSSWSTNSHGIFFKGAGGYVIDGFEWTGGYVRDSGQNGIYATWGKNIRFKGTEISTNSKSTTNTYDGVRLSGANLVSMALLGCRIGNFASGSAWTQKNNVMIESAVTATVQMDDCDLSVPGTGGGPLANTSPNAALRLSGNIPRQMGLNHPVATMLRGTTAADVAANPWVYLGPAGGNPVATNALYVPGVTGAVQRLYVATSNTPGPGQTYTITLNINAVATALVATVVDGKYEADVAGLIPCGEKDSLSLLLVTSPTAQPASFRWFVEIGM